MNMMNPMKTFFYSSLLIMVLLSCNQKGKVIIKGNILNSFGSKMQLIDQNSLNTFPFHYIYPDANGNFSDTLEIEKPGFYSLSYDGWYQPLYLKKNETIEIQILPNDQNAYFFGKGDFEKNKNNNNFNTQLERFINEHFSIVNEDVFMVSEHEFLKYITDLKKLIDNEFQKLAKIHHPEEDFKRLRNKINQGFYEMVCYQFETFYPFMNNNKTFVASHSYSNFTKSLVSDKVALLKEDPSYRNLYSSIYVNLFYSDLEKQNIHNPPFDFNNFAKFMFKNHQSKIFNDMILADNFKNAKYQSDTIDFAKTDQEMNEYIFNTDFKNQLQEYKKGRYGLKIGKKAPQSPLVDTKGKAFDWESLNGKPSVIINYASYSPEILPILKQMLVPLMQAYKDKAYFVFVNLDGTDTQFQKTNHNLLVNIEAIKLHAKKGLNSVYAKEHYVNSLILPSLVLLDSEGRVASQKVPDPSNPFFSTQFVKHIK